MNKMFNSERVCTISRHVSRELEMGMYFNEGDWVWHRKKGVGQVGLSSDKEVLVEFEGGVEENIRSRSQEKTSAVFTEKRRFSVSGRKTILNCFQSS